MIGKVYPPAVYDAFYPNGWEQAQRDPGRAPARHTYEIVGITLLHGARYLKEL